MDRHGKHDEDSRLVVLNHLGQCKQRHGHCLCSHTTHPRLDRSFIVGWTTRVNGDDGPGRRQPGGKGRHTRSMAMADLGEKSIFRMSADCYHPTPPPTPYLPQFLPRIVYRLPSRHI
jgi:hypothetical protein